MPDVHTQTLMTGNRIETVLQDIRSLKNAKSQRTYRKKKAEKERKARRIVDQVGKRMAEHIVEAVQKTVRQARKKARAPAASAFLPAIEDKVDVMGDRNDPALNPDLGLQVGRRTGEKRSMYLSRRDFERHGYTDGCRGCLDLASGKPRAGSFLSLHSAACRRQMEAMIKADDPDRWARWTRRVAG